MRLIDGSALEFAPPPAVRNTSDSYLDYKFLLRGEDADSPQNFEMARVRSPVCYRSPQHRHNWDQLRIVFEGKFGDGKGLDVKAGQIGYYPEGVYYSVDTEKSDFLLFQFGGASGNGTIPYPELGRAIGEMASLGEFKEGVFRRHNAESLPAGVRRNQDAYEAIWEYLKRVPIKYPKPRYTAPVIMDPRNSDFLASPDEPGVQRKTAGVFTERLIEVGYIRVSQGSTLKEVAVRAPTLLYVLEGRGLGPAGEWKAETVVELRTKEDTTVTADQEMLICYVTLPRFDAQSGEL